MKDELLQVQATMSKLNSMSHRSWRLTFDTQEEVSAEIVSRLMDCYERLGYLCFLVGEKKIAPEQVKDLPEVKDDAVVKTPSQRLKAVLFKEWELTKSAQYKKQYPSEVYYRGEMEKIINARKEKLP